MRKLSIFLIFAALVFSPLTASLAKDKGGLMQNSGGFSGPISGASAETVAKALELADEAPVVLTGHIIAQTAGKKDKFIFKDQTGEIVLDIDKKVFRGQNVTPQNMVRISGKVDKDWGKDLEIDVKRLEILQ